MIISGMESASVHDAPSKANATWANGCSSLRILIWKTVTKADLYLCLYHNGIRLKATMNLMWLNVD